MRPSTECQGSKSPPPPPPTIKSFVSGDWDVHWGYDLGFDPWPYTLVHFAWMLGLQLLPANVLSMKPLNIIHF